MTEKTGFAITNGKGFHMTFENGLTISVQFGEGNYCNNRNKPDCIKNSYDRKLRISGHDRTECETAEIAIWNEKGEWVTKHFLPKIRDDVEGWLGTNEVARLIWNVSQYKGC